MRERTKDKLTITLDNDILLILDKMSKENCVNISKFINKIIKKYFDDNDIR